MPDIEPQPGIMEIDAYVGGESTIEGVSDVLKLSSNENPLGAPPAAREAVREVAEWIHRYPSSDHSALRMAIAEVHQLDVGRIIVGNGSDEIISLLAQAYAGPGDEVIHTEHGFAMYRISALAAGARPVEVKERDRVVDVDAILAAVTPETRLVFVANPANPTGTMLGGNDLARLAAAMPSHALLVLDGAYAEYVEGYDGGAALVEAHKNVVMTRTFSKIYGLGGLRVGWGYAAPGIIDVLHRVRGPFNVNGAGLAAAEAAVRDRDWVARCRALNAEGAARIIDAARKLGLDADDTHANFVTIRFADAACAQAADGHFRARGIILRRIAGYGLPEALRVTVPDREGTDRVIAALTEFVKGRGQ